MRPVVIDGGVLVDFCDANSPLHEATRVAIGERLAVGHPFVVPATAVVQALAVAYGISQHAVRAVDGLVNDLAGGIQPVSRPLVRAAGRFRAERLDTTTLHTAFILGAAKVTDAAEILTTEPSLKRLDGRATILEPGCTESSTSEHG